MQVLVIGGAGYIGSQTVKALKKDGFNPIVLDNLSFGNMDNISEASTIDPRSPNVVPSSKGTLTS